MRLPVQDWGARYTRATLGADLLAAVIVTIMLVPQSLAYALLAGLPPEAGLYASVVPVLLYAALGSSSALAVGPVAVVSLMTATAIGGVADLAAAPEAALTLALLSGAMLLAMGLLRMGAIANFLSHPVIAGFIAASAILIALGQLGALSGIRAGGQSLPELLVSLWEGRGGLNPATLGIGAVALAFLFWVRRGLKPLLRRAGLGPRVADAIAKAGPVMAVVAGILAIRLLVPAGVAVVGDVPQGLPPFTLPPLAPALISALWLPALMIALIGFVESVSVAETLAARRGERIRPNQELIGLGAANIGAAFTGGLPVTGGFARSVVNADAGAASPAAGAFTALMLAVATLTLTPLLHDLPKAVLAATIIVAVVGLIDLRLFRSAWAYSRPDFAAVTATFLLTLAFGVEAGVAAGVALSLALILWRTSRPHVAEVGLIAGTEHFRNVLRHPVLTDPGLLTLRIDESLTFTNARWLADLIAARVPQGSPVKEVVLMCSAVNLIDLSALETLEALTARLKAQGVRLHLSEVKGPVMDKLKGTAFLQHLTGQVFFTQYQAVTALTPSVLRRAA